MADIYPYVRTLLLQSSAQLPVPQDYVRESELLSSLGSYVQKVLKPFDVIQYIDVEIVSRTILIELVDSQIVTQIEQEFAGKYYLYIPSKYSKYRDEALSRDKIFSLGQAIGGRFFLDVFTGFRQSQDSVTTFPDLGFAPASNRVVTFSDNQIIDLDLKTSEVIEAVRNQNQVDELPGLRELLIGQLQAGRELIRAGSVRMYLLELTLIQSLKFLIKRYEGHLISGLAGALMTALVKSLGVDA